MISNYFPSFLSSFFPSFLSWSRFTQDVSIICHFLWAKVKLIFYWIIDLQCYVSFCYTANLLGYTYTYIHSFFRFFFFPYSSLQSTEFPVLYCRSLLVGYLIYVHMLSCFSHVWLFATPWTVACQIPLSIGSSRQEYLCLVTMHSSRVSSWPRDWNHISYVSYIGRQFFTTSTIWEAHLIYCKSQVPNLLLPTFPLGNHKIAFYICDYSLIWKWVHLNHIFRFHM